MSCLFSSEDMAVRKLPRDASASQGTMSRDISARCPETSHRCPRQDSNLRTALRRRVLYPLSYGGPVDLTPRGLGPVPPPDTPTSIRTLSASGRRVIQQTLIQILRQAVAQAATELGLDTADLPEPELSRPRQKDHGDWAT